MTVAARLSPAILHRRGTRCGTPDTPARLVQFRHQRYLHGFTASATASAAPRDYRRSKLPLLYPDRAIVLKAVGKKERAMDIAGPNAFGAKSPALSAADRRAAALHIAALHIAADKLEAGFLA